MVLGIGEMCRRLGVEVGGRVEQEVPGDTIVLDVVPGPSKSRKAFFEALNPNMG